uniref:uncharacterized protein n=1 Tax=Myxine glutinosa TaxID=7769 RepID=UPI00358E58B7
MSPIGKMGEFCEEKEDWSQYMERLEFFFTANGIEGEERKRAVLLTVIGPAAFGLLKRLVEPRKVGRESFASLVETMREHLESEPSDIVHRFEFNSRERRPCESVALFNDDLIKLAERCNFRRVRDDMLRDRLVCGVNDQLIRRRLLSERQLTYERALEIALGIETAAKDAQRTTSTLPARQGSMETGCHPHHSLRQRPSSPQRSMETGCHPHEDLRQRPSSPKGSMETGCHPHHGLRQRPSSPQRSMETGYHPHDGLRQHPSSPQRSMETGCHPHHSLWQRPSSPQRSMETGCHPHEGLRQCPSSPKGFMETGCHPHHGLRQRPCSPQRSMETGCHPHDGLRQSQSSPQRSMETGCHPHEGLRQCPSSPKGFMETGCHPHHSLRQRPCSPQRSMETGCHPHEGLRKRPSFPQGSMETSPTDQTLKKQQLQQRPSSRSMQKTSQRVPLTPAERQRRRRQKLKMQGQHERYKALDLTEVRGDVGVVPTWLESQGMLAEALHATVEGLGVMIVRELCSRTEPAPARVWLCSFAARRFTCATYAKLCCFIESCIVRLSSEPFIVPGCVKDVDDIGRMPGVLDIKVKDKDYISAEEDGRYSEDGTPLDPIGKFPCAKCSCSLSTMAAWQLHMERHRPVSSDKRHKCRECPYSTDDKSSFRLHARVHTGEKPYTCSVCGKTFGQSSHQRQHMRIHNNDRPHSCAVCSKTFNRLTTLQQHTRIHTGERPFVCTMCAKTFSHPSALQQHVRIHTGERPYSCTVCTRTFSRPSALHQHVRIHTGERPYTCTVCGKTFRQIAHCKTHMACCKYPEDCNTRTSNSPKETSWL